MQGRVVCSTVLDRLDSHANLLGLPSRRSEYAKVLEDSWKHCPCSVCQDIGIDIIFFRGLNRNKRREP